MRNRKNVVFTPSKKAPFGKIPWRYWPGSENPCSKDCRRFGKRLSSFLDAGASTSLLKDSRKAFNGAASAIRCYLALCELKGTRPFPIKERVVLQRSALFNETATFQQYINSMRKVCYILREPLDWATKAVVHAAYGLRLASANRIRFPNFIRIELIWRLNRCLWEDDALSRLAYISCLSALRVSSDSLQIRRAHKGRGDFVHTPSGKGFDRE